MMVTPAKVRKLALALEDASEVPHFDRAAFRTTRRIFMTMAGDGRDVNFMFDPPLQAHYAAMAPEAFEPLANAWGKQGATRCVLKAVDEATFRSALAAAHARALAPLKKPRKRS
jgi:hypothetical protein